MSDIDLATAEDLLRSELIFLLRRGDAHQSFLDAVADFPSDAINRRPPNTPYTFWHLVEHVRFCQADMIEYLENPGYEAVTFPDDYWPDSSTTASDAQWEATIEAYRTDLDRVDRYVRDQDTNLYVAAPHAWEQAHTPLRTVLVMADHAAYHGGEIGILRQTLGLWPSQREDRFTLEATVTQNRAAYDLGVPPETPTS